MENMVKGFWKDKKVFLTGHTGFKGSWLLVLLNILGAKCKGYALNPPTDPSLYRIVGGDNLCESVIADITDGERLKDEMRSFQPDVVIHMAAQPIVLEGYKNPLYTYNTNVMGTVNVLEAVRVCSSVKAFVNVTTDKVYENCENPSGYTEEDRLGGFDPYSSSKACSELVTSCYRNSFFSAEGSCLIATARAGNVIGGGDFAKDRLIPDCVRAALKGESIVIRNASSVRPWQFVLEPLYCYLKIAEKLYVGNREYATCFNIGPDSENRRPVKEVLGLFCREFDNLNFTETQPSAFKETSFLALNNEKAKRMLGFKPAYSLPEAVKLITDWTKAYISGKDMFAVTNRQTEVFLEKITER